MNIVLLGPPGAGKGTQATRISDRLGIPHISTGDMFRKAAASKTELGLKAKEYMNRGELVPDEIVIGIVKQRLGESDCDGGFLLDGFPRTVAQAEALSAAMDQNGRTLTQVVNIEVGREELIKRLTGRRTCSGCGKVYHMVYDPPQSEDACGACGGGLRQREDDSEETVRNRLKVYEEQTAPLIKYYGDRDLLNSIDGQQQVDAVFDLIEKTLPR